jgi:hypothetical protein
MLVFGGGVLAFGGCALFLTNLNFGPSNSAKETLSWIGALVFIGGVLAFCWGALWAIARLIDRRRPPSPPSAPAA